MKRTRICGYQPQYFPRLHYFNRLFDSDIFEISDYVQFVKKHAYPLEDGTFKRGRSFQAHTIIKNAQGPLFLSVPTQGELLPINKTVIDYSKSWAKDHLRGIEIAYRKAPNFQKFFPEIEMLLSKEYPSIADLSLTTMMWGITRLITYESLPESAFTFQNVLKLLQKNHPYRLRNMFLASESSVPPPVSGKANEWCIALCKYVQADEYIYGGTSQRSYMDTTLFAKAGIKTKLQDWKWHIYPQQYQNTGFISNISIIDLLMNTSQTQSAKIIKGINTFPKMHPAKIIAYGAATFLEHETIMSMRDIEKLF